MGENTTLTILREKPLFLDLFCGAGGAAVGYEQAGIRVVGVNIKPQPNYPFRFIQNNALTFPLAGYAAYHGSPVCKRWSQASSIHPGASKKHPDLLTPTRERFQATGKPYILENVIGAPLLKPIKLCGAVFNLRVYHHRLFESNVLLFQPHHPYHRVKAAAPGAIAKKGEFWSVGTLATKQTQPWRWRCPGCKPLTRSRNLSPNLHGIDRVAIKGGTTMKQLLLFLSSQLFLLQRPTCACHHQNNNQNTPKECGKNHSPDNGQYNHIIVVGYPEPPQQQACGQPYAGNDGRYSNKRQQP